MALALPPLLLPALVGFSRFEARMLSETRRPRGAEVPERLPEPVG